MLQQDSWQADDARWERGYSPREKHWCDSFDPHALKVWPPQTEVNFENLRSWQYINLNSIYIFCSRRSRRRQVYFSMVAALRKGHYRREWQDHSEAGGKCELITSRHFLPGLQKLSASIPPSGGFGFPKIKARCGVVYGTRMGLCWDHSRMMRNGLHAILSK